MEHEHASLGPAEDPGEPRDVVVAAGEQGAVLGAVSGQRQVGLVRQGRQLALLLLHGFCLGLRPGHSRTAPAEHLPLGRAAELDQTERVEGAGAASVRIWRSGGQ